MLESSLNIHDDVLQKEVSKSSNEKMNQIVATIQRSQNAIIRNETSPELIIQGVAGSGKTSISLHRCCGWNPFAKCGQWHYRATRVL